MKKKTIVHRLDQKLMNEDLIIIHIFHFHPVGGCKKFQFKEQIIGGSDWTQQPIHVVLLVCGLQFDSEQ